MPFFTVTITDTTQTPQSIYNLLTKPNLPGYTVVPAVAANPNVPTLTASVTYLSIQASYGNGGTVVYKGDQGVKNDGTRQAKELIAGDTDVQQAVQYSVNLNLIYLTASANGAKVNVESHTG
jgi:hypothetical protein